MDLEDWEKILQLQYENLKLIEEVKLLKKHASSLEENYNSLYNNYLQKENCIKGLKQQNSRSHEIIRDKEQLTEQLQLENENYIKLNEKISAEIALLKKEFNKERKLYEMKEEELLQTLTKLKEENEQLQIKLNQKLEQTSLNNSTLNDLWQKNKELEDEKQELLSLKEHLLNRINEENGKKLETTEDFVISRHDYNMNKSDFVFYGQNFFLKDCQSLNLKEEILQVEIEEKTRLISHLSNLLAKKEEDNKVLIKLIINLKQKLEKTGILTPGEQIDFCLDSALFFEIQNILLGLIFRAKEQLTEHKSLAEVQSHGIFVEEDIQREPSDAVRMVETISTATQTNPVEIVSPLVRPKDFELKSKESNSFWDCSHEKRFLSIMQVTKQIKCCPVFFSHKNLESDLNLDRLVDELKESSISFIKSDMKHRIKSETLTRKLEIKVLNNALLQFSIRQENKSFAFLVERTKAKNEKVFHFNFDNKKSNLAVDKRKCKVRRILENNIEFFEEEFEGEVAKIFKVLGFITKTDSTAIERRLNMLRRKIDQGTVNDLQSCIDVNLDYFSVILSLKRNLYFMANSSMQLTAQQDKLTLKCLTHMIQYLENFMFRKAEATLLLYESVQEDSRSPKKEHNWPVGFQDKYFFSDNKKFTFGRSDSSKGLNKRSSGFVSLPITSLSHLFKILDNRTTFIKLFYVIGKSNGAKIENAMSAKGNTEIRLSKIEQPQSESPTDQKAFGLTRLLFSLSKFRGSKIMGQQLQRRVIRSVAVLICLFFLGSFFVGYYDYFFYANFQSFFLWLALPAFFVLAGRFYCFLFVLVFTLFIALITLLFWLTKAMLQNLTSEEIDNLLRFFGLVLEMHYRDGPPPV